MKRTLTYFLTSTLLLATSLTYGQVTIGNTQKPLDGAILDLKEHDATQDDASTAKRGLGLPRVELQDIDKLQMGEDQPIYPNGTEHTGLIVYHVMSEKDICEALPSGLYVWAGSEWQDIGLIPPIERPNKNYPVTSKSGLNQPNSYLVTESCVLKIPIEKAKLIWDGSSWMGDKLREGGAITEYDEYPLIAQNKTFTNLSAELVWSTDQCGDFILNADELKVVDDMIEVWVSDMKGNAVIALKEGEEIVWSWHIWATEAPAEVHYDNGTDLYTFMDRNIGASSAKEGNSESIGLHYQWGRKDPFPTATDWSVTADAAMNIYKGYRTKTDVTTQTVQTNEETNLRKSINEPLCFITSPSMPEDWYTATEATLWSNRWGANPDTKKAVSDPCPEGWRVPKASGTIQYPWRMKTSHPDEERVSLFRNEYATSPWQGLYYTSDSETNFPWVDNGRLDENGTYYPASGARHNISAKLINIGTAHYSWTANPGDRHHIGHLRFLKNQVRPGNNNPKGHAFSVRCMKYSAN